MRKADVEGPGFGFVGVGAAAAGNPDKVTDWPEVRFWVVVWKVATFAVREKPVMVNCGVTVP